MAYGMGWSCDSHVIFFKKGREFFESCGKIVFSVFIQAEGSGNETESPSSLTGMATPTQSLPPELSFGDKVAGSAGGSGIVNDDDEDQRVLASITAEMGVDQGEEEEEEGEGGGLEATPLQRGVGQGVTPPAPQQQQRQGGGGGGGEGDRFVCPTCGKEFDRPYRYQRHLQVRVHLF